MSVIRQAKIKYFFRAFFSYDRFIFVNETLRLRGQLLLEYSLIKSYDQSKNQRISLNPKSFVEKSRGTNEK